MWFPWMVHGGAEAWGPLRWPYGPRVGTVVPREAEYPYPVPRCSTGAAKGAGKASPSSGLRGFRSMLSEQANASPVPALHFNSSYQASPGPRMLTLVLEAHLLKCTHHVQRVLRLSQCHMGL